MKACIQAFIYKVCTNFIFLKALLKLTYAIRCNIQDHPYHLVSPSPWPYKTAMGLLALTIGTALSMHSFSFLYIIVYLAISVVILSMAL